MPEQESDLASLFPNLPSAIVREFESAEQGMTDGALTTTGEKAIVTDADVEAYLHQIGSLHTPFANNGRMAPPVDHAVVEEPDLGGAEGSEVPAPESQAPAPPVVEEDEDEDDIPPPPGYVDEVEEEDSGTGTPPPPDTRPPSFEAQLAERIQSDPNFAAVVRNYLTGQQQQQQPPATQQPPVPAVAPTQAPVASVPTTAPSFIQYTEDELADPAIAKVAANQAALAQQYATTESKLRQQAEFSANQLKARQLQDWTNVANTEASMFASKYRLEPQVMQKVRDTAARLGIINTYMGGTDPITGLSVIPDFAQATRRAFEVAYHATPETQAIEADRLVARRQADFARKAKLGGVGGSRGSTPTSARQVRPPQNEGERREAMNEEMTKMLNGSWTE